jgi:hypothetical protein
VWDQLVEQFTTNLLAGTSLFPEGQKYDLAGFGNALRYMALVRGTCGVFLVAPFLTPWKKEGG